MKTTIMALLLSLTALNAHALQVKDKFIVQKDLEIKNGVFTIDGQPAQAIKVDRSNCELSIDDAAFGYKPDPQFLIKAGSEIELFTGNSGIIKVKGKSQGFSTLQFAYLEAGQEPKNKYGVATYGIMVVLECRTAETNAFVAFINNQVSVNKVLKSFESIISAK